MDLLCKARLLKRLAFIEDDSLHSLVIGECSYLTCKFIFGVRAVLFLYIFFLFIKIHQDRIQKD